MEDEEQWANWGNYGISALMFAIEHCMAGRKAKTKYIDAPLSRNKSSSELTKEEIQKQRELFVAQLQTMKANFDLGKKNNKEKDGK